MPRLAQTASNRSEAAHVVPPHRGYDRETLGWIRAGMKSINSPGSRRTTLAAARIVLFYFAAVRASEVWSGREDLNLRHPAPKADLGRNYR